MAANPNPPSYTIDANVLAKQWLLALGWPDTAANENALAAWFKSESPHSGNTITVKGNNPLNIGQSPYRDGYWLAGGGKVAISTFATPATGILAFRTGISSPNHNYPGIVKGFQVGNGQAAISAIINSGWVTGGTGPSYNHAGTNLLQDVYDHSSNSGTTTASSPVYLFPFAFQAPGYTGNEPLTEGMIQTILGDLTVSGPNDPLLAEEKAYYEKYLGQPIKGIPVDPTNQAGGTLETGPFGGVPAGFGLWVLQHLAGVGAILAGGALTLFGLYLITKEATGGGSGIVSPIPVILREGA